MSLERKQNRTNKEGKYIGFKNGLTINEEIKDVTQWSKEDIERRTGKLVDKAMDIFGL